MTPSEASVAFAIYSISGGFAMLLAGLGISYVIQACRNYYYCYDDCRLDDNKKEMTNEL